MAKGKNDEMVSVLVKIPKKLRDKIHEKAREKYGPIRGAFTIFIINALWDAVGREEPTKEEKKAIESKDEIVGEEELFRKLRS